MFGDVVQDVKAHVESVVSAKMDKLEERVSELLSGCAKDATVREEADTVKVLLAGIEMRFREEHSVFVEAINAHTAATKAQTSLLEALFNEVKTMNGKMDVLCSQTARLENIERDVAAIVKSVQTVVDKATVVSSFISGLNEHVDDIGRVVGQKANEIRKAQEEARLAELQAQDERRQAEEAASLKEAKEREKRKAEEAFGKAFTGKNLETMMKGISALKGWTGKASANVVYDSKVDPFTDQSLFDRVKGKANIALVGFTADGDVFGGFYHDAVTEQEKPFWDPNLFVFSFESRGRCETPQKFAVKEEKKSYKYVWFDKNDSDGWFVQFGGGFGNFCLGNEKSDTYCHDLSDNYVGIDDDTLTGEPNLESFTCTRIVAVHLQ